MIFKKKSNAPRREITELKNCLSKRLSRKRSLRRGEGWGTVDYRWENWQTDSLPMLAASSYGSILFSLVIPRHFHPSRSSLSGHHRVAMAAIVQSVWNELNVVSCASSYAEINEEASGKWPKVKGRNDGRRKVSSSSLVQTLTLAISGDLSDHVRVQTDP